MRRIYYLALVFIFSPAYSLSSSFEVNSKTDNIETFDTKFIFRPFFQINALALQIKDQDNTATAVTFLPNISLLNPGVAFSYDWIGGSFVYNIPGTSLDKDTFGTTRFFDLQFNWHLHHFAGDLIYQDYKGFYLLDPGAHGESERLRPDMTMQVATVNTYFIFDRNFSPTAAFKQSERQVSNGGSLMVMLSAKYYSIANSSEIIPKQRQTVFAEAGTISSGRFADGILGPGYGYTTNLDKWALTATISGGLGLQNQQYSTATEYKNRYNVAFGGNLKWSAVYREEKFFAGSQFSLDAAQASFAKGQFLLVSALIQFFAGWRF